MRRMCVGAAVAVMIALGSTAPGAAGQNTPEEKMRLRCESDPELPMCQKTANDTPEDRANSQECIGSKDEVQKSEKRLKSARKSYARSKLAVRKARSSKNKRRAKAKSAKAAKKVKAAKNYLSDAQDAVTEAC